MKKKKLLKFISSIAMALMIIFSNTLNIFANDIYNNLESSIIKETEDIDLEEEKIVKIELDNKARNILGIEYIKVKISARCMYGISMLIYQHLYLLSLH